MKAKVVSVNSVMCECPKCGSNEVTQRSSFMIDVDDPSEISCEACGQVLTLPKRIPSSLRILPQHEVK